MENSGQAERVLQDLAGCGRFQVVVVILVYAFPKICGYFSVLFMAFGGYNPGWRCLDNETTFDNATTWSNLSAKYSIGSCDDYNSCQNIEFDPDTSTIVTEWGLVCDRAWIGSSITSIQMAGLLVGSLMSGQLSDWYGRKTILYGAFAVDAIANFISVFAVSWQMYAALRFIIGFSVASIFAIYFLLSTEAITIKWRALVTPIPMFQVGGVVFGLTSLCLKDWRHLELVSTFWCVIAFLPVFWVPESLRWLEVKNKSDQFNKVSRKILRTNKKPLQLLDGVNLVKSKEKQEKEKKMRYTVLDLFRPGYKLYALIIGLQWMTFSFIYYGIYLGAKSLYGDLYLNLILVNIIDIPLTFLPMFLPNLIGRVKTTFTFLMVATLSLAISTSLLLWANDHAMQSGTLVLTLVSKSCINSAWYVSYTHIAEIYPTTVRGVCVGWGGFMARIGGIAAPFLFSNDPDKLYICYIVMAALCILCGITVTLFPETKGKSLKETFDDTDKTRFKVDETSCEL